MKDQGAIVAALGAVAGFAVSGLVLGKVSNALRKPTGPGQYGPSGVPNIIWLVLPVATGYYVGSRLSPSSKLTAGFSAIAAPLALSAVQY